MDDVDDFECDDFDKTLKVIVVGNGNVGKTSMTTRYAKGRYTGNYKKTIGVDFMEKRLELRDLGETVNLMIWDTAGQEEFGALTSRYYKGAGAVIYVFSTTDRASFDELPKWQRKVEEECGRISQVLVQNKIDLADHAAMSRREVEEMADDMRIRLFRSCVQDNVNVKEVFEFLCRQYLRKGAPSDQAVADISTLSEAAAAAAIKGSQPSPSYERRSKGTREASDASDSGSTISEGRRSSPAPSPTSQRERDRERGRGSRDRDRDRDRDRHRPHRRDEYDDEYEEDHRGGQRGSARRDDRQRGWDRDERTDRDRERRSGSEKERDRPRDRDQDRYRERDKRSSDRDRDQGRDKGRERDRDRDRDHRDRESERDFDRTKGRQRDRARDRDDRGDRSGRDLEDREHRSRDRERRRDDGRDREEERAKEVPNDRGVGRGRDRDQSDGDPSCADQEERGSEASKVGRPKKNDSERDDGQPRRDVPSSGRSPKDVDRRREKGSPAKEAAVRKTEADAGGVSSQPRPQDPEGRERDSRQNSRSMRESEQTDAKDKKSANSPHNEKSSDHQPPKTFDMATLRAQLREGQDDSEEESELGAGAGKTSTAASESSRVQPSKRRTNGKKTNPLLHKMSKLVYG